MYLTDPNPKILAKKSELVRKLLSFLPRDAVIDDPHETLAYECDALSAYRCPPMVAVLPSTTEEVAKILKICWDLEKWYWYIWQKWFWQKYICKSYNRFIAT